MTDVDAEIEQELEEWRNRLTRIPKPDARAQVSEEVKVEELIAVRLELRAIRRLLEERLPPLD